MIDVDAWRSIVLDLCRERPTLLPHVAVEALRARDYAARLHLLPEEQALCEVFALAHDIGKVDTLRTTGTQFHPLDGTAFALAHDEPRLAALIAHHSGARYEAALRGLVIPYPYEDSIVNHIVAVVDAECICQIHLAYSVLPDRLIDAFRDKMQVELNGDLTEFME